MKKIYQSILLLTIAFAMVSMYSSCTKKDALPNNGQPVISYVRITDPVSKDSLLVGAFQGNLIAIIGQNLQTTTEIWFNDQKAVLTPTYITPTSIFVSIPAPIPVVITNKMKLVFANGQTLLYDFKVQISEPTVSSLDCEYVLPGQVGTLRGDYFYSPMTITFTGGAKADIILIKEKNKMVTFTVPPGAQPGPITVTTNFGVTKSNFWFNDNRNIFISSDPFTGWWQYSFVVTNPGPLDPPAISGNYIRVKKAIGGWSWVEVAGGPASAMGDISKNIPDAAIIKPSDYNLKFEVNTMKPYTSNVIKLNVGLLNQNNDAYKWLPPYDTKGQWQTVIIPFDDVVASYGAPLVLSSTGYWSRILLGNAGGDLDCDISFDNFRVVPKFLKK